MGKASVIPKIEAVKEEELGGHMGTASDLPREPRVKSKRMDTLRSEGNFAWSEFSRVLSRQSTYPEENPERTKYTIRKHARVLKMHQLAS